MRSYSSVSISIIIPPEMNTGLNTRRGISIPYMNSKYVDVFFGNLSTISLIGSNPNLELLISWV
ncbi:MAG: hypothetical protein OIN87_07425 [Candidatus Methanoperedens sp.]|nr:hypothetical protein [Candidatus Methanoperedens sp.]